MVTKQFQCTLKTDVILNVKSASEGPNSTLDFIPGNCFLGIAASEYSLFGESAWEVFHSGKVRFGDAHPAINGARSLRVAASLFHPKLDDSHFFNFHLFERTAGQIKQCRTDFFDYRGTPPQKLSIDRNFFIKSAYDRNLRRAKDELMFGYESMSRGYVFYFEVQSESEVLLNKISNCICGIKRIGRSRSAQYGLVEIKETAYDEVKSTNQPYAPGLYTVYADSRLIILDKFGLPTMCPSAQDLGFEEDAEIVWGKSQLRTFQYAPYNWKRKCFDADRCGIEKGSVFVIRANSTPDLSSYIGVFKNEGFGKVIYNAPFLSIKEFDVAAPRQTSVLSSDNNILPIDVNDSILIRTLKQRKNDAVLDHIIYSIVNEWISNNQQIFLGEKMASQFGEIRAIATLCGKSGSSVLQQVESYISHGVAKSLWENRLRKQKLLSFIKDCSNNANLKGKEWLAVVNLASEMRRIVNGK